MPGTGTRRDQWRPCHYYVAGPDGSLGISRWPEHQPDGLGDRPCRRLLDVRLGAVARPVELAEHGGEVRPGERLVGPQAEIDAGADRLAQQLLGLVEMAGGVGGTPGVPADRAHRDAGEPGDGQARVVRRQGAVEDVGSFAVAEHVGHVDEGTQRREEHLVVAQVQPVDIDELGEQFAGFLLVLRLGQRADEGDLPQSQARVGGDPSPDLGQQLGEVAGVERQPVEDAGVDDLGVAAVRADARGEGAVGETTGLGVPAGRQLVRGGDELGVDVEQRQVQVGRLGLERVEHRQVLLHAARARAGHSWRRASSSGSAARSGVDSASRTA